MSRPTSPQALLLTTALLLAGSATAAAACPAYLNHEFKKLHSSDSVNLCTAHAGKPLRIVNTATSRNAPLTTNSTLTSNVTRPNTTEYTPSLKNTAPSTNASRNIQIIVASPEVTGPRAQPAPSQRQVMSLPQSSAMR